MYKVKVKNYSLSNHEKFTLIAGPCQMESRDHALMLAEEMQKICAKHGVNLIYKSSFDKANRSSVSSKRGIGFKQALPIFAEIKEKFSLPILTDIHSEEQAKLVGSNDVIDILQIPAFLCRQTDLLKAAAETGKVINIKKGQFLAPQDMQNVVNKMEHFGNKNILLTERGASFGYNNLVSDMRSLAIMAETGYPVIFDATHSVQQPGGLGGASGGQRHFVRTLARAAIAVGVAGLFTEIHEDPDNAPSDGPCMLELASLDDFLKQVTAIDKITKSL
ncbi:MAG: 3-deoxy-8-phosphooctulonate synthase [Alphaproteobacteria bacterium]|jgi:2-dehydro-3-deoxyphosphooctonate aldolase (KDO 8-P synthase)|nr:3-deoxy-8-phosphooctulonate synthase [Alphaproteobacteria bacterium]MBT5828393.1 3-deoxy-8-phosphooctulonate synthase [Alphaproteobacteria bacterium]